MKLLKLGTGGLKMEYCKDFECIYNNYEVCEMNNIRCDWVGVCPFIDYTCSKCNNASDCLLKAEYEDVK